MSVDICIEIYNEPLLLHFKQDDTVITSVMDEKLKDISRDTCEI